MHREVEYKGTDEENLAKAVQDIKDYLGDSELLDKLRSVSLAHEDHTPEQIADNVCFFWGISGYWPHKGLMHMVEEFRKEDANVTSS